MNKRFISVLVFAFFVATGASVTVYRLMIGRMNSDAAALATKILVATRNLEAGALLAARDFQETAWSGDIPEGAFLKGTDLTGRAVATPIYSGEPITEKRLGPKGSGGGLAATIPPGMRAAAIRVNDVAGVAGFVVPGAHVDVLVSSNGGSSSSIGGSGLLSTLGLPSLSIPTGAANNDAGGTHTLLQNILVLSAGQDFRQDAEGKPVNAQVVNLLVTPLQAEMLSLASNQMLMQLVLRNPVDSGRAATRGVTMSNIFSVQDQAPPSPAPAGTPASGGGSNTPARAPRKVVAGNTTVAPAEPPHMEIIEGSKRTEVALQFAEVH